MIITFNYNWLQTLSNKDLCTIYVATLNHAQLPYHITENLADETFTLAERIFNEYTKRFYPCIDHQEHAWEYNEDAVDIVCAKCNIAEMTVRTSREENINYSSP